MLHGHWTYTAEESADAFSLRREVFVEEQGIDPAVEFDEYENTCSHLSVYEDDTIVAAGRMRSDGKASCLMERICVKKECRGQGYGDFLVRIMIDKAKTMLALEAHIHAQEQAVGFYETLGFVDGGVIPEPDPTGIIHHLMTADLTVCGGCQCGKHTE